VSCGAVHPQAREMVTSIAFSASKRFSWSPESDSKLHFFGRPFRERERDNLFPGDETDAHPPCDSPGHHFGFAGTGAGNHEQPPFLGSDDVLLALGQLGEQPGLHILKGCHRDSGFSLPESGRRVVK
jgi:hypothetical protein